MYIVTFYSFRGGVGRTTALVNVGLELARRGRKVLLVDFDLESPDLPNFPPLAPVARKPGVVEFVSAYCEKGVAPDVSEFLYPLEPTGSKGGRIWVMPAGKSDGYEFWHAWLGEDEFDPKGKGGPEYWKALAEIDWQALYERQEGYLLFEDTREQWRKLELDYVLIDTHAGITPSLGITTRQLADAVVMIYNPHQKDRDRSDRSGNLRMGGGLDDVSWSIQMEADQMGRKPIEQLFVASQVMEAEKEMLRPYDLLEYENEFGIFVCAAVIPFSHRLLLGESVIAQEKRDLEREKPPGKERKRLSKDRLAREYRRLANEIIKANFAEDPDGARIVLYDIYQNPWKAVGSRKMMRFADARYSQLEQIVNGFQGNADVLAWAARCLWRANRKGRALEVLGQAVEHCPDAPDLLWQRVSYLREVGDDRRAADDLMHLLDVLDPQRQPPPSTTDDKEKVILHRPLPESSRFYLPVEFHGEREGGMFSYDLSARLQALAGMNDYVASALWQLRDLSPEKYEEAKQKPCITSLSPEAQAILFAAPSGPEPREPKPHNEPEEPKPHDLILAKKWTEVVALLEPRVKQPEDSWSSEDILHLFMAYWALGDDELLRSCGEKAKVRYRELLQLTEWPVERVPELQMLSLVLWKTGERDNAEERLTYIDWEVRWPKEEPIFSFWRYERVHWDLFKEDCRDQRQMFRVFRGAKKVLPPVLEQEPVHD